MVDTTFNAHRPPTLTEDAVCGYYFKAYVYVIQDFKSVREEQTGTEIFLVANHILMPDGFCRHTGLY